MEERLHKSWIALGCCLVLIGMIGAGRLGWLIASTEQWSGAAYFGLLLAMSAGLAALANKRRLRLLMSISLLFAGFAPLVLDFSNMQALLVLGYILALNAAALSISDRFGWTELKVLSLGGTWLLFLLNYLRMPELPAQGWSALFAYALTIYMFYAISYFAILWRGTHPLEGSLWHVSIGNAVMFGLWAWILGEGTPVFPGLLLGMGLMYTGQAAAFLRKTRAMTEPVMTKLFGGLTLLLVASAQLGRSLHAAPLLYVYVGIALIVALLAAAAIQKSVLLRGTAAVLWIAAGLYWTITSWRLPVPPEDAFGYYIPFANVYAAAWICIVVIGRYLCGHVRFRKLQPDDNRMLTCIFTLLTQVFAAALLSLQVKHMFEAYNVFLSPWGGLHFLLSIVWFAYAAALLIWGTIRPRKIYRALGSIGLICVSVKLMLFDLAGGSPLCQLAVAALLGAFSYGMTRLHGRLGFLPSIADGREAPERV